MRAVVFTEIGDASLGSLVEAPDPVAAPGEIVVAVEAAPVNFVDLLTIQGKYQFTPSLPYTPGKGPAGTVVSLGSGVEHPAVGDRVLAMAEAGGWAERVRVRASDAYVLPTSMSMRDAASMSVAFDTAWVALRERVRLTAGERVLVLGASGAVGQAAVQLALAMGAAQVCAGVASPNSYVPPSAEVHVIDLSRPNLRDALRDQVHAATGDGVDVVVDPIGGAAFGAALRALRWCGRLVVVGFAAGSIPTVATNYLLLKNIEVSGLQISDYRKRRPELVRTAFEEVFAWFEAGTVSAPASVVLPLEEWGDAVARAAGRQRPRMVLEPSTA